MNTLLFITFQYDIYTNQRLQPQFFSYNVVGSRGRIVSGVLTVWLIRFNFDLYFSDDYENKDKSEDNDQRKSNNIKWPHSWNLHHAQRAALLSMYSFRPLDEIFHAHTLWCLGSEACMMPPNHEAYYSASSSFLWINYISCWALHSGPIAR